MIAAEDSLAPLLFFTLFSKKISRMEKHALTEAAIAEYAKRDPKPHILPNE